MVTAEGATIALVTGANRGIGRAIALGLARSGLTVVLGARAAGDAAGAARELSAFGDVHPIALDVTDVETVRSAARSVHERWGHLDVLVNNAGINIGYDVPPSRIQLADMRAVYETNVFGVVSVTHEFLPLLRRSRAPRIVNVSSLRGSLGSEDAWVGPWSFAYGTAKTALNAVTAHYARELAPDGFKVNVAHPGHVATDLTRGNAPLTPEQGAVIAVKLATLGSDGPTGQFFDENGAPLPW